MSEEKSEFDHTETVDGWSAPSGAVSVLAIALIALIVLCAAIVTGLS